MALIGDIRKRSGLLVAIIGIALAAFILGDLLSNRNPRKGVNTIGEIDGEPILATAFNQKVDENIEARKMNSGKDNLTSDEQFQVRQATWDQMVNETLLLKEVDKLGLTVSKEELDDQIRGPKPHSYIQQSFTDPQTGAFDPTSVTNFLQNLDNVDPQMKQRYLTIEKAIKEDRLNTKFRNLVAKGYYIPSAFAKRDYEAKNTKIAARYYVAPYTSISDSAVSITNADYDKFYKENKFRYQQEASRDIEYVAFDVVPSEDDHAKIDKEVKDLYAEFINADNLPSFVNTTSDTRYDSTWLRRGALSYRMDSVMFNSEIGTAYGPYVENNVYTMGRLVDTQMRPDSLKASHILISYTGTNVNPKTKLTKAEASAKADSILNVVKATPAKFDELASTMNDDATAATTNGDLNWFADGAMVPAFNTAVLNGKVGDIVKVETQFGFHIIKITGKTAPVKKVRVAIVNQTIEPSSRTVQDIYTEASKFALGAKDSIGFNKLIDEKGLTKRLAERISAEQNGLPGIPQGREIVRWAFDEKTDVGDISSVFDVEGRYVVGILTQKRKKGIATLDQVKEFIKPQVIRDKKAEKLMADVNKNITSMADLAKGYQTLGMKADTSEVTFSASNLPGYGPENQVIGILFSMKKGEISKAIKGNQGVFVVVADDIIAAPAKDDLTNEKRATLNSFRSRAQREVTEAMKRKAKIDDKRLMFF